MTVECAIKDCRHRGKDGNCTLKYIKIGTDEWYSWCEMCNTSYDQL